MVVLLTETNFLNVDRLKFNDIHLFDAILNNTCKLKYFTDLTLMVLKSTATLFPHQIFRL